MRDQLVRMSSGAQLVTGVDIGRAWLELTTPNGVAALVHLTEGELLMVVEAFAAAYADMCGADPGSIACGVNRTLRNRTKAARERRRAMRRDQAA